MRLLTCAFCLLLLCCCTSSSSDSYLLRASSLLPEHPDSAEAVLDSMPPRPGDRASARMALYRAWIANRRGDNGQDSLLRLASGYYRNHDEMSRDRMILHYLKGLSRLENKNYGGAIISLLRAEETAQQLNDDHHLGLIYRYIAEAYNSISNHVNEIHYCSLSLKHFQQANSKNYINYAINDLAIAYNNAAKYKQAEMYAYRVLSIAKDENDSVLEESSRGTLGTIYIAKHQFIKCLNILQPLANNNRLTNIDDMRNYGIALLNTGRVNEAKVFNEAIKDNDSTDLLLDYHINYKSGNYKAAFKGIKCELDNQDKLLSSIYEQAADEQVSRYLHRKNRIARENQMHERNSKITLIVVFFTILLLIAVIYYFHNIRINRLMDRQIAEIHGLGLEMDNYRNSLLKAKNRIADEQSKTNFLNQQIQERQAQLIDFHNRLKDSMKDRFSLLDELCDSYYEYMGTSAERAKVYNKVMGIISDFRNSTMIAKHVEEIVNSCHNNIIEELKKNSIKLSDADIKLFSFIVSGLSPRAISVILNISLDAFYNRKTRLKRKIATTIPNSEKYTMLL